MPFTYHTTVQLHQTDAAGLIFFSRIFELAHDAYQSWMNAIGFGLDKMLADDVYLLPLVHAEADYKNAFHIGDPITIHLKVARIGETSFSLDYDLARQEVLHVRVKTVHVFMAKTSGKAKPLPEQLVCAMKPFLESAS